MKGARYVDLEAWPEGFSPQKTHRLPQLLSTSTANTCCPTRAAARIICSVCFSDQTPSLERWAICSLKAASSVAVRGNGARLKQPLALITRRWADQAIQ